MYARLLATAALIAAAPQSVDRDPAHVIAGNYQIDPAHSQVEFSVTHLGISEYSGRSGQVTGRLSLDPAKLAATTLDVTLPTASIDTPSAKLNTVLQGVDWLDGAAFPAIRFEARRVIRTAPDDARIEGELTLHGVTRPVTLAAHFAGSAMNARNNAYTLGFGATGTFSRSDFGITTYRQVVGDTVTVRIALELTRIDTGTHASPS